MGNVHLGNHNNDWLNKDFSEDNVTNGGSYKCVRDRQVIGLIPLFTRLRLSLLYIYTHAVLEVHYKVYYY